MRTYRLLAGLLMCSLATVGTASAQAVNYTGQTAINVTVSYVDLPADTQIFLLNQINGVKSAALVPLVSGSGSLAVPIPSSPGQYYVLAQQAGVWTARSVMFYTQ